MKRLIYISFICLLCACQSKEALAPNEYIQWAQKSDSGLYYKKQIGHLNYEVIYKPLDYLLASQKGGLDQQQKQQLLKENQDQYSFTLRIGNGGGTDILKDGIRSEQEYYARMDYFNRDFNGDFELWLDGKKYPCTIAHLERTYGLTSKINISVTFNSGQPLEQAKEIVFVYKDQVFGSGPVKVQLDQQALQTLPELKV